MQIRHDQDGVIARAQLLATGHTSNDIRRLVRRRELSVVHSGIYVDHTGPLTWRQQAWAAILWAWPAGLGGMSVVAAGEARGRPIEVVVAHSRRLTPPEGITVTRLRDFDSRVRWNLAPPRLRYEDAVLDVASTQVRPVDRVAVLAAAVGSRRTTPERLRMHLEQRPKLPHRSLLGRLVEDIAQGTHSVLEHGYMTQVERAHGLPQGHRQVRAVTAGSVRYRDVEIDRIIVELDGRMDHDSTRGRDRDLERDLDAVLGEQVTVRLGWGQVFERPCQTAVKLAALFAKDGWMGAPVRCGPRCVVAG